MPRPQRSRSKTNPAFDPQELADLIHIPAVGRGVSSHLLDRTSTVDELTTVAGSEGPVPRTVVELTTVVTSSTATEDTRDLATVVVDQWASVRVEPEDSTTVVASSSTTVADLATVPMLPTVAKSPSGRHGEGTLASPLKEDGLSDLATIPMEDSTTVVVSNATAVADLTTAPMLPTVAKSPSGRHGEGTSESPLKAAALSDLATVPIADSATVVASNSTAVADLTTAPMLPTVAKSRSGQGDGEGGDMTTVGVSTPLSAGPIWVSEEGSYVPPKKVRRVRDAQEALSAAEASVYDLLWSQQGVSREEQSRVVQAGYDFIMKRTRLSKKTVQRIIDKLIDKDFIAIEVAADIYRRLPTTYRVFGYRTVLERMAAKNRLYIAKIGPGIVYVAPLSGVSDVTTVASSLPSTVANSLSPSVVRQRLLRYGPADDDTAAYLVRQCRRFAADATFEEIAHFIDLKGELTLQPGNRMLNPIGFLLATVPKCFQGEELRLRRQNEAKWQSEVDAEFAALQEENRRILADPQATEEDRRWARKLLEMPQK